MSIIAPADGVELPDTIGRPPSPHVAVPAGGISGPDTTGTASPVTQTTTPPIPNTTGTTGTVLNSIA